MDIFGLARLASLGPLGFKGLDVREKTIRSAVVPFVWGGPVVTMDVCGRCASTAPAERCTCGFHAAYSAGHVIDQYAHLRDRIVVLVEAQGKVIPHERGWRAEQCVVHAVVELYAGNMIKHMMNVRASQHFGGAVIVPLEEAIEVVQAQRERRARGGRDGHR